MEIKHLPYVPLRITSPYGRRNVSHIKGATSWHDGVDIGRDKNKYPSGVGASGNVYSVANGTVINVGENKDRGKYVIIQHNAEIQTLYQHLNSISVKVGQNVKSGDTIGQMGCTGVGNATHLHFEIRANKKPIDPTPFLMAFKHKDKVSKSVSNKLDENCKKLKQRYNFDDDTIAYLRAYKYADILIEGWLYEVPKPINAETRAYILAYKYGKEILRRVYSNV